MSDPENFYIHLNSDVHRSSPLQVGNTIGNFVTRLNRRYNLSDDYEVALSRFHYTKSWYNIEKEQELWLSNSSKFVYVLADTFPAGNYLSVQDIIDLLNGLYEEFVHSRSEEIESPPKFEYNSYSNTVRVKLGIMKNKTDKSRFLYPTLSDYMANFLGLADRNNKQYPFSEISDLIVKTQKKTAEVLAVSYQAQYHQQVDQLAVQVADFKEVVTKFLDDKKKTKNNTQKAVNKDRSFDAQQKLATKKDTKITDDTTKTTMISQTSKQASSEETKINNEKQKSEANSETSSRQSPAKETVGEVQEEAKQLSRNPESPSSEDQQNSENKTETKTSVDESKILKSEAAKKSGFFEIDLTQVKCPSELESAQFFPTSDPNQWVDPNREPPKKTTKVSNEDKSHLVSNPTTGIFQNSEIVKKSDVVESSEMHDDQPANDSEQVAYIYAFKQVSLHGYINNLNIYCNLVKPIAIGDIEAPLLRSVAVSPRDRFGEFIQYEPHIREYVPLLYHEFENIEIDIKDDSDRTIDFKFGKVYLSLHFKKINFTNY